ncbi:TetR family transcriptional regulator [Dictyobacter sp. S3.2.2.5]|uniref:TetR family transcriptional regulator n=1 Tax=Dictyobacter halimunensis TaxID=3026934 RepID=A0ABQ6FJR0_9CHLR|nr:TetR family transcriptional regulator [Dictyobacter sp. S3.2.2.5]
MEQPVKHPSSPVDQETRRQIVIKAAELFLAKGYKGVSMKELAEAVEVTSAALYYHFPKGKEDLFTTMIQTVFVDEGVAGIDQVLAATQDVRERLTLLTAALLSLPLDERLSVLLRDAREHLKDPEHQQVILSLLDRIRQQVMGLFQAAHEEGAIRPDLPVNVLVGLYMGMLREAKDLPRTQPAASLVSVLFDGIARRAE